MPSESFPVTEIAGARVGLPRAAVDSFVYRGEVDVVFRDKDGNVKSRSHQKNLRTNAGANFWNAQLFGAASATAVAKWIALTTDATAPGAGDTTLTSEETTNGLVRTAGSVVHTNNAATTTISVTFTYTGAVSKVIAKVGLFDAVSGGNLVLETLLNATGTVNANGDTITVTWTVNF